MRLFAPVSAAITEKQEMVRKRVFMVRSIDEACELLLALKREGFVGSLKCNIGRGGIPNSVETEERARL